MLAFESGSPSLYPLLLCPTPNHRSLGSSHTLQTEKKKFLKGRAFELMTNLSQATLVLFLYQHVFYINGNFGKSHLC